MFGKSTSEIKLFHCNLNLKASLIHFRCLSGLARLVHELIPFLAPLTEQNITQIFRSLRMFTFYEKKMGHPN